MFQNFQGKNYIFQLNTLFFFSQKNNFSASKCFKGTEWKRHQFTDYNFLLHYAWCAWLSETKIYKATEISNHLSTWWYINTAHWSCIHFIFMNLLPLSLSFLSHSFFRITIKVLLWYDSFQWYKCCIISLTNKLLRAKSFTTARTHSFILVKEGKLKYNSLLGNSIHSINWLQFIYISSIYTIFARITAVDHHLSSWSVINQMEHNITICYKSQFQWECLFKFLWFWNQLKPMSFLAPKFQFF